MERLTFPNPFVRRNGNSDFLKSIFLRNDNFDFLIRFRRMETLKMSVLLCKTDGFCMGVDPKIDPESMKIWFRAPSCPSCFSPKYQNGGTEPYEWQLLVAAWNWKRPPAEGGALNVATAGSPSRENAHRIIKTQKCQSCPVKLMVFGVHLQERILIESSKLRNVSFA